MPRIAGIVGACVILFADPGNSNSPNPPLRQATSLIERDSAVAKEQPGPHNGGGQTTGYSFFTAAPNLALVFRKRALHPGAAIGYHRQEWDEIYYVLSGTGELTLNGQQSVVGPGTAILTRTGSSHGLRQVGPEDLVIIIAYQQAPGQAPAQQSISLLGRWVGDSHCVGAHAACHDEHVIYQIDSAGPHQFTLDGSRIAGGDTVDMGALSCQGAGVPPRLSCRIPSATWQFSVVQGRLEGVLTLADNTVMRRVVADRAQR